MYRRNYYYDDSGYEREDAPRQTPREEYNEIYGSDEGYYYAYCSNHGRTTEHDPCSGCVPCNNVG
jgi:hypothetical protein